jgi:hypothetical protein
MSHLTASTRNKNDFSESIPNTAHIEAMKLQAQSRPSLTPGPALTFPTARVHPGVETPMIELNISDELAARIALEASKRNLTQEAFLTWLVLSADETSAEGIQRHSDSRSPSQK